jgi:hypothetical protein
MTRKNWLRVGTYGTLGAVVLIFVVHPYTRQTVIGPRIRGMPFAYWQDRYREAAAEQQTPFTTKVLALIGVQRSAACTECPATPEMLPVVLTLVDDPTPSVRARVAACAGQNRDSPDAGDALLKLVDDSSAAVRRQATRELGRLQPPYPPADAKLRERLADDDAGCRLEAAFALCRNERVPSNATLAVLRNALPAVDARARLDAVYWMCDLGSEDDRYLPLVAEQISLDASFRRDHVKCLAYAGRNAIPFLVRFLDDDDLYMRLDAVMCLGHIGRKAEEAVPALEQALQHPDEQVRKQAATELWQIDPQRFARPAATARKAPATNR